MKIFAIETSCDETSAAIVEDGTKILASTVASSQELHKKTGGIIPEIAAREQIKCIIPIINEAMKQCNNVTMDDIDAIAVTVGPGLIGSLLVGVETAKTIAYITKKPIVPVNHIFAHFYANWLRSPGRSRCATPSRWPNGLLEGELKKEIEFPAIALVVSGGHTELFLMEGHGNLKWLGGTRDDAAGEAFDKTARLLRLGYPGGPAIAACAAKYESPRSKLRGVNCHSERNEVESRNLPTNEGGRSLHSPPAGGFGRDDTLTQQVARNYCFATSDVASPVSLKEIRLPRPMIGEDNLDFSFSGLKTAVMRELNKLKTMKPFDSAQDKQKSKKIIQQLAYEIQEAITDVLVEKTIEAAKKYKVKSILLGGGVAANQKLAEKFHSQLTTHNLQLFIPPPSLCTDNAAYIASYAYFNYKPVPWQNIQAKPDLEVEV